jgi:phage shock protein A
VALTATLEEQRQEIEKRRQEATDAREEAAGLRGQVEALERVIAEWKSQEPTPASTPSPSKTPRKRG